MITPSQSPLISVLMTVYNQADFISQAIDGVLQQSYRNLELLIVNDNSTDGSDEIINKYSQRDERISIICNQTNLGGNVSQNLALQAAQGKYVANLDGDDYWIDIHKLAKQVNFMEQNNEYVLVGGLVTNVDTKGNIINKCYLAESDKQIRKNILSRPQFAASSVLFRREPALLAGGYLNQRMFATDLRLWLALGQYGKFYNFPVFWQAHRLTGRNIGETKRKEQLQHALAHIKNHRHDYPHFWQAWFWHRLKILAFSLPAGLLNSARQIKNIYT